MSHPTQSFNATTVFFLLGGVAAVFGAALWPLFYWEVWPYPPHLQHPRIMIFGFGLAFLSGALESVVAQNANTKAPQRAASIGLLMTWLAAQVLYASHQLRWGDLCTAAHLALLLMVVVGPGLCSRKSSAEGPPLLLVAGILSGLVTSLWWTLEPAPAPTAFLVSKTLAWQGMLLLSLLGISSTQLPRLLGSSTTRPDHDTSKRKRWATLGVAALIIASLAVEGMGWVRLGNAVRFAVVMAWAAMVAPGLWRAKNLATPIWGLRFALVSIASAFLIRAIWPGPAYAIEHVLLIAGFGLALLLLADPRTFHANASKFTSRSWHWIAWLTLLTALTRVGADMKASLTVSHHIYAALLWIAMVGWARLQAWRPLA